MEVSSPEGSTNAGRKFRGPLLIAAAVVVIAVAAFFAGRATVDDHSGQITSLEGEVTEIEQKLSDSEEEGETERQLVTTAEEESEAAKEEAEEANSELADERAFKGEGEKQQSAETEYEVDYPWEAAGSTAGGELIVKPVGWEKSGEKWVLTMEVKNTAHEPLEGFCGSAGATVLDAEENQYTGSAVLSNSTANCGESLQPGATATYAGEFKIPSKAVPVVVYISGNLHFSEEEGKAWELPH
jgi:hypothetical protein